MGRNFGRIGGAVAGIIAITFGILDVQDKVPPCLLIPLGALAIAGVVVDYLWDHQGSGGDAPQRVKQRQQGGRRSTNNQAARDINVNYPPKNDEL